MNGFEVSIMKLWDNIFRRSPTASELGRDSLDNLAAEGVEVVIFVTKSISGKPCSEAIALEGGRIPIKLAEPIPLQKCDNINGCDCEYKY